MKTGASGSSTASINSLPSGTPGDAPSWSIGTGSSSVGSSADYSNRVRYRLQVTTPLNRLAMEPGAYFVNFYNELFLNFDDVRAFDQNRLYVAGGYQLTPFSNLQVGLLWQARSLSDFFRLQIFYTHNFDLRDR